MSFIDDVAQLGSDVVGWLGSGNIGSSLATTALAGFALSQISKSVNTSNNTDSSSNTSTAVDTGSKIQVQPDTTNKIPVIYGAAFVAGIITDAQISNNNLRMHYVYVLSEKTGAKLSDGQSSSFTFKEIYYNNQRLVFDNDGITALYSVDSNSVVDYSVAGLVKVYCFNGSSASPVVPQLYSNSSLQPAYSIVPNWTTAHTMDNLIFAVVEVNYSKEKNVTSQPTMIFHVSNNMTLPGDCILDYATNTRYGAGIPAGEIYSA